MVCNQSMNFFVGCSCPSTPARKNSVVIWSYRGTIYGKLVAFWTTLMILASRSKWEVWRGLLVCTKYRRNRLWSFNGGPKLHASKVQTITLWSSHDYHTGLKSDNKHFFPKLVASKLGRSVQSGFLTGAFSAFCFTKAFYVRAWRAIFEPKSIVGNVPEPNSVYDTELGATSFSWSRESRCLYLHSASVWLYAVASFQQDYNFSRGSRLHTRGGSFVSGIIRLCYWSFWYARVWTQQYARWMCAVGPIY